MYLFPIKLFCLFEHLEQPSTTLANGMCLGRMCFIWPDGGVFGKPFWKQSLLLVILAMEKLH